MWERVNQDAIFSGSTKSRLTDVMEYFKSGRHRIIVATSVLEEGIDITKCNLVIRYEHVTNEIVRLQSRGNIQCQSRGNIQCLHFPVNLTRFIYDRLL